MGDITIAIDGPAGAGKSTIAKMVSKSLGIIYLDTGAMYRAVALKAIREGIGTRDEANLEKLVQNINIRIEYHGDEQYILLDGEDVREQIRTPVVSRGASDVSAVKAVRIRMVELQREIAAGQSVVMDGRDIGTYVLPDAVYKFYLNASLEERAKRRYLEQCAKGTVDITLEEVCRDIEYRDKNDSNRNFAPLRKADDAIEIDTTNMTIHEVAKKILLIVGIK